MRMAAAVVRLSTLAQNWLHALRMPAEAEGQGEGEEEGEGNGGSGYWGSDESTAGES